MRSTLSRIRIVTSGLVPLGISAAKKHCGSREAWYRKPTLPDYRPGKPIAGRSTPDAIPYASYDLSVIAALAEKSRNIDVKVYGRAAGYVHYRRTPATIEKTHFGYSADGKGIYSGDEKLAVNSQDSSVYEANVRLEGSVAGKMALKITFGPLGGRLPAQIIVAPDATGMRRVMGILSTMASFLRLAH